MSNEKMSKVAKEILSIKISKDTKIGDILIEFYEVMRQNGIKAGTKHTDSSSITFHNYEWTMCMELFKSMINDEIYFQILLSDIPKDILHY